MEPSPKPNGDTPRVFWPLQMATLATMVVLGIAPESDRLTWFLENLPVMAFVAALVATRRRLPLAPIAYWLVFIHALIIMQGGYFTYSEVPMGHWASEVAGWSRNHYDRFAHLMGGVVWALVARGVLLGGTPLQPGAVLSALVLAICLSMSAIYEFMEWWAAVLFGEGATAFMGTQGDPWDTHWDMFLCVLGAAGGQLTLKRVHDRQLGVRNPASY